MQRVDSLKAAKLLLVVISLLAVMIAVSCNKNYPYPELLSGQEGKYYILYVGALENNHMRTPELLQKVSHKEITGSITMWSLENAQKEYPKLELVNAPVFVIFDTKGMVLKTEDEQKAMDFLLSDRLER
jgi:hypothetical protein